MACTDRSHNKKGYLCIMAGNTLSSWIVSEDFFGLWTVYEYVTSAILGSDSLLPTYLQKMTLDSSKGRILG